MAAAAPERPTQPVTGPVRQKVEVQLIPWDPDNEDHVKMLYDQRVACGWKEGMVKTWRKLQRRGDMGIHFVVRVARFTFGMFKTHMRCFVCLTFRMQ